MPFSCLGNLFNNLIALPIFFLLALVIGSPITFWVLLLPFIILIQACFTLGVGLISCTLNVFYRDTHHILDVLLLAWFFLTPIFYPITTVPEQKTIWGVTIGLRIWLRRLNPMASIIASYRDIMYWGSPTGWDFLLRTALVSLVILVVGYLIFLHFSSRFGEEI